MLKENWLENISSRVEKVRGKNPDLFHRHIFLKTLIGVAVRVDEYSAFCKKCEQLKSDIEHYLEVLEYEGRDIRMGSDEMINLRREKYEPALRHLKNYHGCVDRMFHRVNFSLKAITLVLSLTLLDCLNIIYWSNFFSLFVLLFTYSLALLLDRINVKSNKHI